MKLSDYIVKLLLENGCTHVFGYPGGAVTHIIDSLYKNENIRFVPTYHEQAAAFAAEGYARIKNGIGVALATSGPGATNLITGIGSAYFDSIPCLYLTGQVNTYEYKGNLNVRQIGFQETDIVSIVLPITKYAVRITEPKQIKYELEKAITIAKSHRKGPVLIDIPMDIQRAEITEEKLIGFKKKKNDSDINDDNFKDIIQMIKNAKRPVLLVGGGIRLSNSTESLEALSQKLKIPVVSTLMGRDAYDNSKVNYLGMLGTYGNRYANLTIANADLVIACGTRLDTRQTGTNVNSFVREGKLIRIDIDSNELAHTIKNDEYLVLMDLDEFFNKLIDNLDGYKAPIDWINKVKEYKSKYPTFTRKDIEDPNYIMHLLSSMTKPDDVVCVDVGQNQMWAAQSLCITKAQRFITSGGMGSMGFALPAAIGAYYSGVKGNIFVIAGDGGFQMNIQELELIRRNQIPIKIILMNNSCLGMIRHFQEMYFEGRYNATIKDYVAPDFCKIAEAYGINSVRVNNLEEFMSTSKLFDINKPLVIDIRLPQHTYVFPKLSVNKPIEEQDPLLSKEEMDRDMIIKPFKETNIN